MKIKDKLPFVIWDIINDYYEGDIKFNRVINEIKNTRKILLYILDEEEFDYRIDEGMLFFQNRYYVDEVIKHIRESKNALKIK